MISPKFPFKDNQIILSSDRIMLHSKTDGIFLFGKGTVSLSSPNTVNIDATEKTVIFSPKIELGNQPTFMEPTIKGRTFLLQLAVFFEMLEKAGSDLANGVCETDIPGSMTNIVATGQKIKNESQRMKNLCKSFENNAVLSKTTFVN